MFIRQFRKIKSNVSQECKYNFKRQSSVALDALDSICDRQDTDDSVSFLYSGDINRLLQTLSAGHISDLTISEPDLEEIFLHYYEKVGDNT